jgi:hypothetical protein
MTKQMTVSYTENEPGEQKELLVTIREIGLTLKQSILNLKMSMHHQEL